MAVIKLKDESQQMLAGGEVAVKKFKRWSNQQKGSHNISLFCVLARFSVPLTVCNFIKYLSV